MNWAAMGADRIGRLRGAVRRRSTRDANRAETRSDPARWPGRSAGFAMSQRLRAGDFRLAGALRFAGAFFFAGALRFAGAFFAGALRFAGAFFAGALRFAGAFFAGALRFAGAFFAGAFFAG